MTDTPRPPDAAGHLSPEQLDDLVELPAGTSVEVQVEGAGPAPSAHARDHLGGCPACTAALAEQRRIRELLRGQADPGPMPDDVAARLDAALAAAAREREPAGGTDVDLGHPATVLPLGPARERRAARLSPAARRAAKAVVGVAAAALIAVGGYAALHQSSPSATASKGSADSAAAPAAGALTPNDARAVRAQATGTAYTKANIAAKVSGLLRTALSAGTSGAAAAGGTAPLPQALAQSSTLGTPAGLTACVNTLSGVTDVRPLLVDLATFEGKPAAIIVLPAGTGEQIWVVSRSCTPADDGTMYFAAVG